MCPIMKRNKTVKMEHQQNMIHGPFLKTKMVLLSLHILQTYWGGEIVILNYSHLNVKIPKRRWQSMFHKTFS